MRTTSLQAVVSYSFWLRRVWNSTPQAGQTLVNRGYAEGRGGLRARFRGPARRLRARVWQNSQQYILRSSRVSNAPVHSGQVRASNGQRGSVLMGTDNLSYVSTVISCA